MQVTDNLRLLNNFLKKNIVEAFTERNFCFNFIFFLLLYGNQHCFKKDVPHKLTYMRSIRGSGCRELSLSSCPGVWNKPPRKKKIANPQGLMSDAQWAWLQVKLKPACIKSVRKSNGSILIQALVGPDS